MPAPSSRQLRKVTMNFYAEDIAFLEARFGPGWSEVIRELVHTDIRNRKLKAMPNA